MGEERRKEVELWRTLERIEEERKKEEERRKEVERLRKYQPLASEVDIAAKKGDIARVKQLQQSETTDTPLLLELRSRLGAGEYQGDRLGLYHLTIDTREESKRQGLVYRQLHDGDNQQ